MILVSCNLTLIRTVISSLYPFISRVQHSSPRSKIMTLFLAFSVCFVVLSISIEGLFYSAFTCNLLLWIDVEAIVRKASGTNGNGSTRKEVRSNDYRFQADDVRIALFFLFFVQVAFFGTGKYVTYVPCLSVSHVDSHFQRCVYIVSYNWMTFGMAWSHNASSSFYLEPVYRLVPVFNPFLMAALLVHFPIWSYPPADLRMQIFKIVVPYVILSAVFATLNARLCLPSFSLFLVALTLTDGEHDFVFAKTIQF